MHVRSTSSSAAFCPGLHRASMLTLTFGLCRPRVRVSTLPFESDNAVPHIVIPTLGARISNLRSNARMLSVGSRIVALASTRARAGLLQIVDNASILIEITAVMVKTMSKIGRNMNCDAIPLPSCPQWRRVRADRLRREARESLSYMAPPVFHAGDGPTLHPTVQQDGGSPGDFDPGAPAGAKKGVPLALSSLAVESRIMSLFQGDMHVGKS